MKELVEVLHFMWSVEFWRMGVCWTLSLIMAYARLLVQKFLSQESKTYGRCSTMVETMEGSVARKPVCVITGVINTLLFFIIFFILRVVVVLVNVGS